MAGLENQVALITAATSKIGYAYAKHLLQNGVKVALCDVNLEDCQSVANEFADEFSVESILALECAIADQIQLENAFTSCINHFGRLDIVVNNTADMEFDESIDDRDETNDAIMRVHYDVRSSHNLNIRTMALCPRNVSDYVGRALIYILKKGSSGQYWIVENEEIPRLAE